MHRYSYRGFRYSSYVCKRNRHRKIAEERDGSLKTISYTNEKTVLFSSANIWLCSKIVAALHIARRENNAQHNHVHVCKG
ncbi:hypothetical protein P8452_63907 [Trifolium repens]|nr:hypothetical protein P8452_63907 [Trifolium repens]